MINSKIIFKRTFIVFFWVSLIFIFLYFPAVKDFFGMDKSINILVWPDIIDVQVISEFEKQTGIRVNINYYENNEELFAKLDVTKGQGYDLITITDVGVEHLRKKNLLKKLDKTKLKFIDEIDPHFLGHYFDSKNEYSVPYNWDIYGVGINLKYFDKTPEKSWDLIFNPKYKDIKITMLDDAYDVILLSAMYLYGDIESIDKQKLEEIQKLLIQQKSRVEVYDTLRVDYFLKSGICPAVVSQSAYIYRAIKDTKGLAFVLPKEGTFMIIESLVIPEVSKKADLVYEFINFLYNENQIRDLFEKFGYLPTLKKILYSLDLDYIGGLDLLLDPENFKKYFFLKRLISPDEVSQLWINVRSS
ncbi:MAG: extracellular solute-binding protein [Candidatus Babeliales bacterium]|nr:extracellular solute-binding protein [Candidatus Babeliales bacterium]